jgi:hypothetical protein
VVDSDGKPMVVYHGTQRPDRVGDRFRKSRATSGPMAFFTNDPAIASSYSTNKRDTSAEMPSDYAGWFKWKGKGMRSPVAIDRAWWNLSPEERAAVNERIYTIGYSDWDASEGPIVADSQSIMSRASTTNCAKLAGTVSGPWLRCGYPADRFSTKRKGFWKSCKRQA